MREHWGGRIGFILAAAGSAIGLGNVWRFPYLAGENGGGAFLMVYLAIVLGIGASLMLAEVAIGRASQRNPFGAFVLLKGGAWKWLGALSIIIAFLINSYYCVIGGWTLAYMVKSAAGFATVRTDFAGIFESFIADGTQTVSYHALFAILTVAIVLGGVKSGIERWNKILLPALFIILLILIARAVTLPGAEKGLAFYLTPDFSSITGSTVLAALNQAFFSLSLAMGAMITYGSYLSRKETLPGAVVSITLLDTLAAVLSGLLIFPAVFALGFDVTTGPGLTFITLPGVFAKMNFGAVFGTLFFALLAIAALTSAISLLEVVVAYLVDEHRLERRFATVGTGVAMLLFGIPSALSFGPWSAPIIGERTFFDLMDFATTNLMLPLNGILISIFVGWVITKQAVAEVSDGAQPSSWVRIWIASCRYVVPAAVFWILVGGL